MSRSRSDSSFSSEYLRAAGILERFFYTRTRIGVDSCVVVAARYDSNSDHPLTRSTLFSALEEVVRDHAELAARLLDKGGSSRSTPSWHRLQAIDFDKIVEFLDIDSHSLEAIIEAQFMRSFDLDADLPLWRLSVLTDSTVVFAYDHAMGDGQSGLAFHLSLLAALRMIQDSSEHSGTISLFSKTASMLPPLEDAMTVSVPLSRILHEVWKAIDPLAWLRRDVLWTGNPVPPRFRFGTRVRVLQLSPDETARLVQLSRSHGTTVTGTLYALAAHALSHLLRDSPDKRHYTSIAVFVPVSLRRYTGAPPTAICNHVSYHQETCPLPACSPNTKPETDPLADFPWAAAARFSGALKRAAPSTPATIGVMNALIGSVEGFLRGMLGRKRDTTFEISNLGPVAPRGEGEPKAGEGTPGRWEMRETVFAQADPTLGAALKLNVTGSPAGGLGIALTWGREALDEQFANSLVASFAEGLGWLISSALSVKL
ncbi:alcohol acetyltransferase [Trametes elegans]|nr:alcohol acetyltransferase [Trametes elegans]